MLELLLPDRIKVGYWRDW